MEAKFINSWYYLKTLCSRTFDRKLYGTNNVHKMIYFCVSTRGTQYDRFSGYLFFFFFISFCFVVAICDIEHDVGTLHDLYKLLTAPEKKLQFAVYRASLIFRDRFPHDVCS